jgi:hypothetical protein
MKRFPLLMCVVVLVGILSATAFEPQGKSKGKKEDKASDKDKGADKDKDKAKEKDKAADDDNGPKPLFQGNLGIKSSRQGKDSAALGFNGLDPEGHVTKDQMAKTPTKADTFEAMALVAYSPTSEELAKFMAAGTLKAGTPPTEQPEDKKKKKK